MLRALFLLPLLFLAGPSDARCLFCENDVIDPAVAYAGLERTLETPLPDGTEVVMFIQGGFQDLFWQFVLRVPEAEVAGLLETLKAEDFRDHSGGFAQPDEADWAPSVVENAQQARITLGTFPYASLVFGADPEMPGHVLIYVFAHEV